MSVHAWRRGVSSVKSHLAAVLADGKRVRCEDEVACEWLGQRGNRAGPDDADVIVKSSSTWPDEATADMSDGQQSTGEMQIIIPMTSSREHGLVAGQLTLDGVPINVTSSSTRRDCLLASNDLDDLVSGSQSKESSQVRQVSRQAKRRADQLAVDLEYADASSILQSILKYGGVACLLFAMFGKTTPVRILLAGICGVVIASASSTFTFAFAPYILGYITGPIVGVTICALGWKFASKNLVGLLTACLLGDLVTGGYLGSFSGLGANPVIGARYYGVGNELSALLVGCALSDSDLKLSLKVTSLCVIAILIGHPMLGANGGDMVAVFAGLVMFAGLLDPKKAIPRVLILVVIVMTVVVWDGYFAPTSMQSHLGRLVATAGSGIPELIASKASTHFRLMSTSAWGITSSLCLVWWVIRHRHRKETKPDLAACVALPLFLLNDSGPVSFTLFTLVAMSCDSTVAPKNAWSWITKYAGALRHK